MLIPAQKVNKQLTAIFFVNKTPGLDPYARIPGDDDHVDHEAVAHQGREADEAVEKREDHHDGDWDLVQVFLGGVARAVLPNEVEVGPVVAVHDGSSAVTTHN